MQSGRGQFPWLRLMLLVMNLPHKQRTGQKENKLKKRHTRY